MTIFDFYKRFPTDENAIDFLVKTKDAAGYYCPKCGSVHKVYRQKYNTICMYLQQLSHSVLNSRRNYL